MEIQTSTFLHLLCFLAAGAEGVKNDLSCYQCTVKDNSACSDKYLQPCPNTQAFDRCETRIRKEAGEDRRIEKRCALAPCNFSPSVSSNLGLTCDTSKDHYDCVTCCKGDGCNKDAAMATSPVTGLLLALQMALVWVRRFMDGEGI
ncbi:uncharacterized protein LOC143032343 [Oratosquilla oratoria]|uniref:uncharacterized protein LOC143032343 n=1 Tax=Oratosquilla oratoria TaxID=337810 RepID=UPI003F75B81D